MSQVAEKLFETWLESNAPPGLFESSAAPKPGTKQ